jgi:sarcinarray family protein
MEDKMKFRIIILILILLLFNLEQVSAEENDYGIVKAWFNEKNATIETIEGLKLKIGEPVELKIEVISKINGNVYIKLMEPGTTKAFDIISGPSKQDERIDNLGIVTGWSRNLTWIITPNGAWKNGNAPLNIFVQFNNIVNGKLKGEKKFQFTIANPYILDEQYFGAVPTPETAASPVGIPKKETPFLSVIFTVGVLLLASRWRREKSQEVKHHLE